MNNSSPAPSIVKVDRHNPFPARVIERSRLTPHGDDKETFHIVLDIRGSDLDFKVGDSIGIYGQNNPKLVDSWISALKATGLEDIVAPKTHERLTLREFLSKRANLARLTSSLFKLILNASAPNDLLALLSPDKASELSQYLKAHEPLDVLRKCSPTLPYQALCDALPPLLPRFYSIASSKMHSPDQIDLTVAHMRYHHHEEPRYGVASHFLCHLAELHSTPIPIYLQPAIHFALPQDTSLPIIMIGPGTGVAPYRGFMQERIVQGAQGKNWLFFGERQQDSHFYYAEYWKDLQQKGHLHLSTAFSRDQEEKVYVQHRLLEHSKTLWQWVQDGAVIYVCGDAEKMAKQVEATWISIFESEGNLSHEEAKTLLHDFRKQKRYLTDVY